MRHSWQEINRNPAVRGCANGILERRRGDRMVALRSDGVTHEPDVDRHPTVVRRCGLAGAQRNSKRHKEVWPTGFFPPGPPMCALSMSSRQLTTVVRISTFDTNVRFERAT